jgi:hypothetical protein
MKAAWFVLAIALGGCPKKEEATSGPVPDTAVASSPALPASFDRFYRGTIGDGLGVTMHLTKNGATLVGTYAYDSTKRDISLTGTIDDKALALSETVDGRSTGSFKGAVSNDGRLVGTWADAAGTKSLPFTLHEEAPPPVASRVATAAAPRTPVQPANDNELAAFLVQFAKAKKAPGGNVTAAQALEDYNGLRLRNVVGFMEKYGLPPLDSSFFVVYVADANNDGTPDYVLTSRNDVGLHNDDVVGVFTQKDAAFEEIARPQSGPFGSKSVYYFGRTFLSRDSEGITMTFAEGAGPRSVEKRYLWKGSSLKLLDASPVK